jgi:hypothetical protein
MQATPAWQGTHSPAPLQTPLTPPPASQETVPAVTGTPPVQAGPPLHESVPLPAARQTLAGVQVLPATQPTQAPTASQTRPGPQAVPGPSSAPVSRQVCAPVEQLVTPAWQRLAGVQAVPAWQATHSTLPLQIPGAPPPASQEVEPAATAVPPVHDGPPLQETVPLEAARQTLAGVQAEPATQPTQAPTASQTWAEPQAVPGLASARVSTQVWAPVVQEVTPTWHGSVGTQAFQGWQALHCPPPLQIPGAPPAATQVTVPAATGAPPWQAGPPLHESVPLPWARQTFSGVQAVPGAQATQAPAASQTWPVAQVVPGLARVPVSAQVWAPVAQVVRPRWQ